MEILIGLLIIAIIISIKVMIDTNDVQRKEINIKSEKIPSNFNGYKIVLVTDLHIRKRGKSVEDKAIERINKEDADIVILGGDYIFRSIFKYRKEKKNGGVKESHGEDYKIDNAWRKLSNIKAKDDVYAVLGNHDYWEPKERTLEKIESLGYKSLDNKAYSIEKNGQTIRLGGVSDISEDMSDITVTTNSVTNEYVILVSHSPVIITLPKEGLEKVDLLLAGHLHGGQIDFFGKYAPLIPKRWKGNIITGSDIINNIRVVISSGIGTSFLPFRFFAKPDYMVITLEGEKEECLKYL